VNFTDKFTESAWLHQDWSGRGGAAMAEAGRRFCKALPWLPAGEPRAISISHLASFFSKKKKRALRCSFLNLGRIPLG